MTAREARARPVQTATSLVAYSVLTAEATARKGGRAGGGAVAVPVTGRDGNRVHAPESRRKLSVLTRAARIADRYFERVSPRRTDGDGG